MKSFIPLAFFLSATFWITSCQDKEKDQLKGKVDSLILELQSREKFAETLDEVGVLMDSIDQSRQIIRVNMEEGATYENYQDRLKDLNDFVKQTQKKIDALEKDLKKSKSNSSAYIRTIQKLKKEIKEREEEMSVLRQNIEKIRNENENLTMTINFQDAMLEDKETQILVKEQELALIESRVQELMLQANVSEADAYYTRAMAVEEVANRTHLAPKKKKETYRDAVELYKKALSLGKEEARSKIEALEKKI